MSKSSLINATIQSSSVDTKILQTKSDLDRQKRVFSTVNLSTLPDKGAKLKNRINELEELLKDLSLTKKETTNNDSSKILMKQEDSTDSLTILSKMKPGSNSSSNDYNKTTYSNQKCFSTSEKLLTFQDLCKNSPKEISNSLGEKVNSPSFKTYRKTEAIPRIQLTEAKPLFEKESVKKKNSKAICSTSCLELLSNDDYKHLYDQLTFYPDDTENEKQPKYLQAHLMDHQIKALSWLIWRESQTPSGGILADDMGLGKTLTMISLILKQREKKKFSSSKETSDSCLNTKGTLIVCLASIINQWEAEIKKHCKKDSLTVLLFYGPKREKDISHMQKYDVVLTTYQIVLSERKTAKAGKESGLFKLFWNRIILDEAHTIKNHSSQTAEAIFALKGSRKWCVTGTPIHNNFKDLYSLIKFLQFHPFDDFKKFKKFIDDESESTADRRNMLAKSILLRRTKLEVDDSGKPLIEMKKKSVSVVYIDLSEEEKKVYDELSIKVKDTVRKVLQDKKKVKSSSLLVMLLRLQQCCSHLSLLKKETEETLNASVNDLAEELSSLSIESNENSSLDLSLGKIENYDIYNPTSKSSKMKKLFEILDKIAEESKNCAKSVIVSQWVSMLELIEKHLKREKKCFHKIIGSTKSEERQQMSEDFNYNSDSCKIMLLSLKAGGIGLNLIGATHLILLDLHWNPALEMQAMDRIHRVGQKNDVFIHKFICKGTIEEKIFEKQIEKSNLASGVLSGSKKITKGLSLDDFKSLFNIRI